MTQFESDLQEMRSASSQMGGQQQDGQFLPGSEEELQDAFMSLFFANVHQCLLKQWEGFVVD